MRMYEIGSATMGLNKCICEKYHYMSVCAAEMGWNFSLPLNFLYVKDLFFIMIWSVFGKIDFRDVLCIT